MVNESRQMKIKKTIQNFLPEWNQFLTAVFVLLGASTLFYLILITGRIPDLLRSVSIEDSINLKKVFLRTGFLVTLTMIGGLLSISAFIIKGVGKQHATESKKSGDVKDGVLEAYQEDVLPQNTYESFFANLAKIQKGQDNKTVCKTILTSVCGELEACQGAIYIIEEDKIDLVAGYALAQPDSYKVSYEFGEGIVGQVAKYSKTVIIRSIPEGYLKVVSGLGEGSPTNLVAAPIIKDLTTIGVLEIASFDHFNEEQEEFINKVCQAISLKLIIAETKRESA